ncbi:MAG TPA: PilZ domain-containing protein [Humidesulfovibrio sp.]|uniref:PilZ domain-containing protein n=1 Tax=Humidesulfovibrio sp. TaxID=2910988 RepID=UPI002BED00D3|nr:PilZ domain-containing protein [Humidesulfovibrio sp.]HWR03621.1 PilZ domain-containing protein [Humidesulfovibrio sp.]
MQKAHDTPGDGGEELTRPVLVLAGRPQDYADDLAVPGLAPLYVPDVAELLDRLAGQPVSGFVLEMDKVLHAPALERGHLFELAEAFPLLRARGARQGGPPVYLDDPRDFVAEVRGFDPRPARHVPRVPVLLHALLTRRSGGGEQTLPATILDLSACGGALNCETEFAPGEELFLSVLELSDPEPMPALICWSGLRGRATCRRCVGVRFLGMRPGQAEELGQRFLGGSPFSGTS